MTIDEAHKTNPNAILLNSGVLFDVFKPNLNDILIDDIAHALSNICRYGGHSPKFYSVAQHCVICSHKPGTKLEKLEFLMHDASEGYLMDMPRPIKSKMPNYVLIEDNLLEIIFKKFNLTFPLSKRVHEVDNEVLRYEYTNFFEIKNTEFEFWAPNKAKEKFLERYKELIL